MRLSCYRVFVKHPFIDLTDPQLGSKLLEDPRGKLPIYVWETYCWRHSGGLPPVSEWLACSDPDSDPIEPQRAVDEARALVKKIIDRLLSNSPKEALNVASDTWHVLARGSSWRKPKRGQPAEMRPIAVRAWVIRKFNPDPDNPNESTVSLRSLADTFFRVDGRCSRCHSDRRHQSDSACVKALSTSVARLKTAMKHDGIPF
jgi:hypothetical protein